MGDGYVRQSAADIVTGNVVEAGPLNAEFNQVQDAFHETSGHSHDGTTGEGPKISLLSSVSGQLQVAQGGTGGIHKLDATTAPTANDDTADGYAVGSLWVDTTNDRVYVAVDVTAATAVWRYIGSTAISALAATTPAADKLPYYTSASAATTTDLTTFGRSLLDDADASAARTTLGLVIGTNVQAYDAELAAIAGLTSAADKGIQFTGVGTAATYDLTSFAKTLLDDANQAAAQTTLGLVPGTDVQAYDADLAALAALSGTNTVYYRSAANTWSPVTFDPSLDFSGGTLSVVTSSLDATLSAMAGVVTAADKAIYFTGVDTAAAYDLTSFARTILDDTDATTARATLGLTIGTNVQAYDATLAALAAYDTNGILVQTATNTFAGRTLTGPAAGISVSNGNGVSGNPTLALANDLAALEALSGTDNLYYRSGADTWTAVTMGSGITFSGGTLSASSSGPTLLTEQATTSGTTKDFTIPAGAKRITVMFDTVRGGTLGVQIGDSGGIESTGYVSSYNNGGTAVTSTSQFVFSPSGGGGSDDVCGVLTLVRMNGSHKWVASGVSTYESPDNYMSAGIKTLSAELTTVRVLGSSTFASGNVNVMWE